MYLAASSAVDMITELWMARSEGGMRGNLEVGRCRTGAGQEEVPNR